MKAALSLSFEDARASVPAVMPKPIANRYSLLGLSLECSRPLPRLAADPEPTGDRVRVELGSFPAEVLRTPADGWRPFFESSWVDQDGEPWLRVCVRAAGDLYRFQFSDGADFLVDSEGRRIWARWREPKTLEGVSIQLLSIILGFVLRLRGQISLHASAVVIAGRAVALAGPGGTGKSTTAAAFAQRGHRVLTDDTTVLKQVAGDFYIQPDRPELRLWPESSAMLFGSPEALPRMMPDWEKRLLDLERYGFRTAQQPRPLAAVYVINGEPLNSHRSAIRGLRGAEGVVALVANSLVTRLLDRRMRIQEFDVLTRLSAELPVRRLHRSERGLTPHEVCALITEDYFRRCRPHRSSVPVR